MASRATRYGPTLIPCQVLVIAVRATAVKRGYKLLAQWSDGCQTTLQDIESFVEYGMNVVVLEYLLGTKYYTKNGVFLSVFESYLESLSPETQKFLRQWPFDVRKYVTSPAVAPSEIIDRLCH